MVVIMSIVTKKFIVFMNREGGNLILKHQPVKPARYKITQKLLINKACQNFYSYC